MEHLPSCDHMLVYLTKLTWASGSLSAAFAADVRRAMDLGVHLLLVHEMPTIGEETDKVRHGVAFEAFFGTEGGAGETGDASGAGGTTPADLLERGIYHEIAIPFKGGEWRGASLELLHNALVDGDHERRDGHEPPQQSTSEDSVSEMLEDASQSVKHALETALSRKSVHACDARVATPACVYASPAEPVEGRAGHGGRGPEVCYGRPRTTHSPAAVINPADELELAASTPCSEPDMRASPITIKTTVTMPQAQRA